VQVKDAEILKTVGKIAEHFQNNISNRFVRRAVMTVVMPQARMSLLENLPLQYDYHKQQGFQYDELYELILAAAQFAYEARTHLLPNLKNMLNYGTDAARGKSGGSAQERTLRDMAVKNFPLNLGILTDLVNELYVKTVALDREQHKKTAPVCDSLPELNDLGRLLVS
jgi:hypothetical protein